MRPILYAALCSAVFLSGGCLCCLGREEPALMPGAYSSADTGDEWVVHAAEFALGSPEADKLLDGSAVLVEIISAETQVAAGTNYRLEMNVDSPGGRKIVYAVVWRKLSGEHELIELRAAGERR